MKILIVDDDASSRKLLKLLIESHGHGVIEAADGQEGLERVREHKPDAVISDAVMPRMDGFHFLSALRHDDVIANIPFILFTAIYTGDEEYELARSLGADALIVKPKAPDAFWKEFTVALEIHAARKGAVSKSRLDEKEDELFRDYCRLVASKLEEKVREMETVIEDLEQTKTVLQESEERYRLLFENNPNPIWVYDLETLDFLAVNDAAIKQYGYSRDEFLSMTIRDIRPLEDIPILMEKVSRVHEGFDKADIWRHRKKDGTIINVEITSHTMIFGGRRTKMILANEVTERKLLEIEQKLNQEKLSRSEQRYRNLVDSAQDVIFELSSDGAVVSLNPVFETITGWSLTESIGRNFAEFVHPDDLGIAMDNFFRVMRGESPPLYVLKILDKSGGCLYGEFLIKPNLQDGNIAGLFGIARDITERKHQEDELSAAIVRAEDEKARADSIIAAIGDGITIQDKDFKILYQNQAAKNLIGDHLGELCYMAYEKREQRCEGCPIAMVFEDGKVHTVLRTAPTDKGILYAENTASPLRDSKGNIVAGIEVIHDITKRKRAEEVLRLQTYMLAEAQRIAHIGSWDVEIKTGKITWSDEMYHIYGVSPDTFEHTIEAFLRLIHPEDRAAMQEWIAATFSGSKEKELDFRILWSDGTVRFIRGSGEVVVDETGNPIRAVGTAQDITERKKIEEALEQQKQFADNLIQNSAVATFVLDAQHTVLIWNRACEELTGFPAFEMIGTTAQWKAFYDHDRPVLADIVLGDDPANSISLYPTFSKSIFMSNGLHAEGWYKNLNGKDRYIMFDAAPIYNSEGAVIAAIETLQDITERKLAEEQLFLSKQDWEETFNTITDMVTIHDKEFNIVRANKAAEKVLGLPFLETNKAKCFDYYHGAECPPEGCPSCLTLVTGKPSTSEMYEPHLKMFIEISSIPRIDSNNQIVGLIHVVRDISERKKAENILKEERNKAQKYLDVAGVMIVALDSSGRTMLINNKGLEILGYEENEVINQNWFELCIPSRVREAIKNDFNKLIAGDIELLEYYENSIITKGGAERILAFHNVVLRDVSGEISGTLSSGEDITEERQAQDELKKRVHQAALGAEIGVILTRGSDLRTTLQLCVEAIVRHLDAAFARIWTLNERENMLEMQASAGMYTHINGAHGRVPVGKFKIGLIAEELKPHLTNQVIGDPRVGDQEWAIREGMVAFAGYPLIVQGRLVGVMAMFSRSQIPGTTMSSLASVADVIALGIERKRTEEELVLYSGELTDLNMASDTLMLITNLSDIYQEICDIIHSVFDLKMVWLGIIDERSFEVNPVAFAGFEDGYLSRIRVTWDDSLTGMGPTGMAIKTRKPSRVNINDPAFVIWKAEAQKRGYIESVSVPLIYARDKCLGALNFYSDNLDYFTPDRIKLCQIFANQAAIAIENVRLIESLEGKVLERTKELILRREEADSANKSKTDFLATMSHELRTPLNAILGFSDIMQQGMTGPLTDKQNEFLEDISSSGNHLLTLITDILDLSKIEAGKLELEMSVFSLKELIETSLVMFKEKALKHGISVTSDIDVPFPAITADQRKLKQVLVNLLSNAFKFTPDKGSINVVAKQVSYEVGAGLVPVLSHPGQRQELPLQDFIEISVSDTGIGISKEHQQKLFQPFQQIETSLTRKYAGTGLGLSLCRRLIELHGGRIWVESEEGKGSRFVFVIPVKNER